MLTVRHKLALVQLIQDEIARNETDKAKWLPILGDIAEDIRRHRRAAQLSAARNAAKGSRRDQRGPIA